MKKRKSLILCLVLLGVILLGAAQLYNLKRHEKELVVTKIDMANDCIYANAKNQIYDSFDPYIIYGVSDYLMGRNSISQIAEGDTITVVSNGKVYLSDPYQFDKIYYILV